MTVIYRRLVYCVNVIAFVDVRMNVVSASSTVLKKLFSTKSGAAFAASYHAKCPSETLTEFLHPFKHDAKKKVGVCFFLLE